MGVWTRRGVAVAASLVAFGGCWLGLVLADPKIDIGVALGWSALPLTVVLAVAIAWAEAGRPKKREAGQAGEGASALVEGSAQGQAIGRVGDVGVVLGPGASLTNPVFHLGGSGPGDGTALRKQAADADSELVAGDVPQEPAAFQPRAVPRVWNIPARNPGFTGRDGLLVDVRERLLAGDAAVVQAFQGMGGVGKTQLAIEYAHRFAGTYGLAWWVNSEQPGLIGDQFAALGAELRCVEPGAGTEAVRAAVLGELRERGGWLLIFDNAQSPADIRPWLPGGSGHVLITSREHTWAARSPPRSRWMCWPGPNRSRSCRTGCLGSAPTDAGPAGGSAG